MAGQTTEDWDLWYPQAAATGIPFARGRVERVDVMLVHAAPPVLTVSIRDGDGTLLAKGTDLKQTDDTPITRLTRRGKTIEREDIWPVDEDIGRLVLLAGGEAGDGQDLELALGRDVVPLEALALGVGASAAEDLLAPLAESLIGCARDGLQHHGLLVFVVGGARPEPAQLFRQLGLEEGAELMDPRVQPLGVE